MGNSTCKPREGGEGLKSFLTRKFGQNGKKKKIDQLVQLALSEDCASLRREAVTVTDVQLDEYYQQLETVVDEYDTEVVELEIVGVGIRPRELLADEQAKNWYPSKKGFMKKIWPTLKKKKRRETNEVTNFIVPKDTKNAVIAKAPMPSSEPAKSDLHQRTNDLIDKAKEVKAEGVKCQKAEGNDEKGVGKHNKGKDSNTTNMCDNKAKLTHATNDKIKHNTDNNQTRIIQVKPYDSSNGHCLNIKSSEGMSKPDKGQEIKALPKPVNESCVKDSNSSSKVPKAPMTKLYGNERVKHFVYNRVLKAKSFDGFRAVRNIEFKKEENRE